MATDIATVETRKEEEMVYAPSVARQVGKTLRGMKSVTMQEQRILDAGWEPFTPGKKHFRGEVEAVSWLQLMWKDLLLAAMCFLVVAGISYGLAVINHMQPYSVTGPGWAISALLGGIITAFVMTLLGVLGVALCFSENRVRRVMSRRNIAIGRLYDNEGVGHNRLILYTGAFPVSVWKRYKHAKKHKLFDNIYVWSTNSDVFTGYQIRPFGKFRLINIPQSLDPILIGVKDGVTYQGGVWDL